MSGLQVVAHVLRVVGAKHVIPKTPSVGQVVLRLLLVERDAFGLVARDTVKAPGEQGYPLNTLGGQADNALKEISAQLLPAVQRIVAALVTVY